MEKRNERTNSQAKRSRPVAVEAVICVLFAVLVLVVIVATTLPDGNVEQTNPSGNSQAAAFKELVIQEITEKNADILVKTNYVTVKYPTAFADLMEVHAETAQDHAAMIFSLKLEAKTVPLYALYFGNATGDLLGTLKLDGTEQNVYAQFFESGDLQGDDLTTFYAMQETCNDVFSSLDENPEFIAAN